MGKLQPEKPGRVRSPFSSDSVAPQSLSPLAEMTGTVCLLMPRVRVPIAPRTSEPGVGVQAWPGACPPQDGPSLTST